MDKAAMVSVDISSGAEVLKALDGAKVKVSVALWAHLPEYADWRLVLAGPKFDEVGPEHFHRLLRESLAPAGFTPYNTPLTQILPMNDPFIKALRRLFGKTKTVEGMRIGGQLFGDRFVEDGYVYRIS